MKTKEKIAFMKNLLIAKCDLSKKSSDFSLKLKTIVNLFMGIWIRLC